MAQERSHLPPTEYRGGWEAQEPPVETDATKPAESTLPGTRGRIPYSPPPVVDSTSREPESRTSRGRKTGIAVAAIAGVTICVASAIVIDKLNKMFGNSNSGPEVAGESTEAPLIVSATLLPSSTPTPLVPMPSASPLVAAAGPSETPAMVFTPAAEFIDRDTVQAGPFWENNLMTIYGPSDSIDQAQRITAETYTDGVADSTNAWGTDWMNPFLDSDVTPQDPEAEPGLGFTGYEQILDTKFVLENKSTFMISSLVDADPTDGIDRWAFKAWAHDDDASALLAAMAEVYSIHQNIAVANGTVNEIAHMTVEQFMQNRDLMQMATVIQGRNMAETRHTDDLGVSLAEQERLRNQSDASSLIDANNRWNDQNVSCNEFQEVGFANRADQTQNLHPVWNISNGASTFTQSNIDIYYNVFAGANVAGETDTDAFSAYTYITELDDVNLESVRMEEKHPCGEGETDQGPTPTAESTPVIVVTPTPGATETQGSVPTVQTSTPEVGPTKTPKPENTPTPDVTRVSTQPPKPTDVPPPTKQPTPDDGPPTRVATQQVPASETGSNAENIIFSNDSGVEGELEFEGTDEHGNSYQVYVDESGNTAIYHGGYTVKPKVLDDEFMAKYGAPSARID